MLTADRGWGERAALAYAWKTLLRQGARLAFGSDAPVELPNPFLGLHAAVTRQRLDGSPGPDGWHPEQRLTIREALEGFILGPAYAAGKESSLGRLARGYLADLIVLEQDPFTCRPDELRTLQPAATMIAGEWVWQS
jgi:predicted amidohydrolase YtcJ